MPNQPVKHWTMKSAIEQVQKCAFECEGGPLVNNDAWTPETAYHPDPDINAEVAAQTLEAERFDLAVGYLPRRWVCECGASHQRGHFQAIGVHRCLRCGYVGEGGIMVDRDGEEGEFATRPARTSLSTATREQP